MPVSNGDEQQSNDVLSQFQIARELLISGNVGTKEVCEKLISGTKGPNSSIVIQRILDYEPQEVNMYAGIGGAE